MLTLTGQGVPDCLQQIPQPPLQLFVKGDLGPLLPRPRLAVVGSRRATAYGQSVTRSLVASLVRSGVVIVSGLAYGIDSIAHRACLDAGGQTIAVLAGDLEHIYPAPHSGLADDIVRSGGALVSESDEHVVTYASKFLERNRLIVGMSDAVLVTEAAQRSGSLNSARHALDQGKTVLAVPGNITSPMSLGCNNLIRAGAVPVTSPDDIFAALNWSQVGPAVLPQARNQEEHAIISLIKDGISDGADIMERSGLPAPVFNTTLTMLELSGAIRPLGGNQWMLG
jgi:DNA processing protein